MDTDKRIAGRHETTGDLNTFLNREMEEIDDEMSPDRTADLLDEITKLRLHKQIKQLLASGNFEGIVLDQQQYPNANLKEANLRKASIYRSQLEAADLADACLCEAVVIESDLSGAILSDADLSDVIIWKSDCSGARFDNAILLDACFLKADLSAANFCGADLSGAVLREVNLDRAVYDSETAWPDGFDPEPFGAVSI